MEIPERKKIFIPTDCFHENVEYFYCYIIDIACKSGLGKWLTGGHWVNNRWVHYVETSDKFLKTQVLCLP
jgi:hypothetical protein